MNPWDWNAKQITRLSDRIDVLPSVREASVTGLSPLTVTFDTDTTGTVVFGTLAAGLREGDRVLTVRLARYVWVLGVRGGGVGGWVDLSPYLSEGVTASGTCQARRVGPFVEVSLSSVTIASLSVPTHGNIVNVNLFTGIPVGLRPGVGAPLGTVGTGRVAAIYATATGAINLAAITPDATQTGTVTLTNEAVSAAGHYLAAS